MNQPKTPLAYACAACNTMMRKYRAEDLPPKGHFHYHQGVFLSGMYKTYLQCNDERYFSYIKAWVDCVVDSDGNIPSVNPGWLDDIQPGILLFPLLERTDDIRYKKALDTLLPYVLNTPRNRVGGFWHKDVFPNQMWLDGLYMAGPICAEYAQRFHRTEYLNLVTEQIILMETNLRDEKSGLWYHAWDESRQALWADSNTGLSAEFWGRSVGWVPVALLDDMDFMDTQDSRYSEIGDIAVRLLQAVLRYQTPEGRWCQVIDKAHKAENWPENSCSCLFVAAISKAVRIGLLDKSYLLAAQKGYDAVIASLNWQNDDLMIGNVCIGTDVGDFKHYCERPVSTNDLHGVGAFLLMCEELEQALQTTRNQSTTVLP
ncbi:MAG: glycoside hydrolase family 88 protein [Christensenella sp.]